MPSKNNSNAFKVQTLCYYKLNTTLLQRNSGAFKNKLHHIYKLGGNKLVIVKIHLKE